MLVLTAASTRAIPTRHIFVVGVLYGELADLRVCGYEFDLTSSGLAGKSLRLSIGDLGDGEGQTRISPRPGGWVLEAEVPDAYLMTSSYIMAVDDEVVCCLLTRGDVHELTSQCREILTHAMRRELERVGQRLSGEDPYGVEPSAN